jgi:hypothetical protein
MQFIRLPEVRRSAEMVLSKLTTDRIKANCVLIMNMCCIPKLEVHMHSVSTESGYPASGRGLDRKNRSIQFQPRPKTSPTGCCRAKPGPVLVDPWVWLALARPVCSKLRFQILGFTFIVVFRYITVDRKIWTLVRHCPLSMY